MGICDETADLEDLVGFRVQACHLVAGVSGAELRDSWEVFIESEVECLDVPRSRSRPKGLLSVRVASWICSGWGLF